MNKQWKWVTCNWMLQYKINVALIVISLSDTELQQKCKNLCNNYDLSDTKVKLLLLWLQFVVCRAIVLNCLPKEQHFIPNIRQTTEWHASLWKEGYKSATLVINFFDESIRYCGYRANILKVSRVPRTAHWCVKYHSLDKYPWDLFLNLCV